MPRLPRLAPQTRIVGNTWSCPLDSMKHESARGSCCCNSTWTLLKTLSTLAKLQVACWRPTSLTQQLRDEEKSGTLLPLKAESLKKLSFHIAKYWPDMIVIFVGFLKHLTGRGYDKDDRIKQI